MAASIDCSLALMPRRQPAASDPPPALPGGYKVGEKVFYTGPSQTLQPGYDVVHGQQGEVTGPATGEATKGKGVTVLYPGNKGDVACLLTLVSRLRVAFAATPACAPHTRDAAQAPRAATLPHLLAALARAPISPTASVAAAAHRPGKEAWRRWAGWSWVAVVARHRGHRVSTPGPLGIRR